MVLKKVLVDVTVGVILAVRVTDGVTEDDAPIECVGVTDTDKDGVIEGVIDDEGVNDGVTDIDGGKPDDVTEGVIE